MATASAGGARLRHEPALDGLRGLAVAAVVLFHGGYLRGGYLGVDAFFVLSGFLITSLLLAEARTTGRIGLGAFWARRARRLLPALFAVVLAVALYAAWVAQPEELTSIRGDAFATLAYFANWRAIFTHNDYWALFRAPSPLEHTWSLAIEEQFYLVWPLVVALVLRRRDPVRATKRLLPLTLGLALVSFVCMQLWFDPSNPSLAYYSTVTRMGSILIGAALATWLARHGPIRRAVRRRALEATAIAAIAFLAVAWTRLGGTSALLYRGGLLACAIAVVIVIAAAVHPQRGPVAHALSWRPLCLLGLISYGVYLWHWPIFVFLDRARTGLDGWQLFGVRVGVTLCVAVASYFFVERPIRFGAGRPVHMQRMLPALALLLVVAVISGTSGAPATPAAAATSDAHGGVLVVGDSVAASLEAGVATLGAPLGDSTTPACRLLAGSLRFENQFSRGCAWRQQWRLAVRKQHPDTVLLVPAVWDLFDVRPPHTPSYLVPGTAAWAREYEATLAAAVRLLRATGARVVIPTMPCVGAVPGAGPGVGSALDVHRVEAANAVIRRVAHRHPGAIAVPDVFALLCPTGRYHKDVRLADGSHIKRVRADGEHYTKDGATFVANFLRPYLEPRRG